jgi:hypothetical protein
VCPTPTTFLTVKVRAQNEMNPTELEQREMMHCQDGVWPGARGEPLEVWIQQTFGTPRLVVPPPLVEIIARHWMCRPRKGNVYRGGQGPAVQLRLERQSRCGLLCTVPPVDPP